MRTLLIAVAWRWSSAPSRSLPLGLRQGHTPQGTLGPSEAQQNRAAEHAVQKSAPPPTINKAKSGGPEQLDTAGFQKKQATGRGAITPQTEVALRAYQQHNGLPMTGILDKATQRSLTAGQTLTPGRPTAGESCPGRDPSRAGAHASASSVGKGDHRLWTTHTSRVYGVNDYAHPAHACDVLHGSSLLSAEQ